MHTTRREFWLGMIAGGSALGSEWSGSGRIAAFETSALDAARRQAARRRRRVICNDDDIWANGADTVEKPGTFYFFDSSHQENGFQYHLPSIRFINTVSMRLPSIVRPCTDFGNNVRLRTSVPFHSK